MNLIQRAAKNISLFFTAQFLSYGLNFLFVIYTARYLGAKGFGLLSFAIAFSSIFYMLADLGFRKLITREVARDKSLSAKYLGNIGAMILMLTLVAWALVVISLRLFSYSQQSQWFVFVVSLSILFKAFYEIFYANFQAHEKMEFESYGRVINAALLLGGALVIINRGWPLISFAFLYLACSIFVFLYALLISLIYFVLPRFEIDPDFWRFAFYQSLPFGLIGVFDVVFNWVDTVMLSIMKGDVVVAWYNVAYRLFLVSLMVPTAFNMAIYPAMSRFFVSSEEKLTFTHETYFKILTALGVAMGLATTFFADKIILLFFGAEYQPAVVCLQILIWSAVLIYINSAAVQLLVSINEQKILTRAVGCMLILNIACNFILIPLYSYLGASLATVLSEAVLTLFIFFFVSRTKYRIKNSAAFKYLFTVAFAGFLAGALLVYLRQFALGWFSLVPAFLVYSSALFLLKAFSFKEFIILKMIFGAKMERGSFFSAGLESNME